MFRFPEQQKPPRRAHSPRWLALHPNPESDLNDVSSGKVRYRAALYLFIPLMAVVLICVFVFEVAPLFAD